MKAITLIQRLEAYPDATVKMWGDDIGNVVVTIAENDEVTIDIQIKKETA